MKLRIVHSDASVQRAEIKKAVIRIGRDDRCELSLDGHRYPKVPAIHAELRDTDGGWTLVNRSKSNKTLLDDEVVEGSCQIAEGSRVRLGFTGPTVEIVSLAVQDTGPAPAPTMVGQNAAELQVPGKSYQRFDVSNGGLIGRDKHRSDFHLDHPHVSRSHARLKAEANSIKIEDLDSANGTY